MGKVEGYRFVPLYKSTHPLIKRFAVLAKFGYVLSMHNVFNNTN